MKVIWYEVLLLCFVKFFFEFQMITLILKSVFSTTKLSFYKIEVTVMSYYFLILIYIKVKISAIYINLRDSFKIRAVFKTIFISLKKNFH